MKGIAGSVRVDLTGGDATQGFDLTPTLTRGRAELLVTATGMSTEVGAIAGMLATSVEPKNPLQIQLDSVGRRIALRRPKDQETREMREELREVESRLGRIEPQRLGATVQARVRRLDLVGHGRAHPLHTIPHAPPCGERGRGGVVSVVAGQRGLPR